MEADGDGELQIDLPERRGLTGKGLRDGAGGGAAKDSKIIRLPYRAELQGEDAGRAAQPLCAAERFGHMGAEENGHIHRQRPLRADGDAMGAKSGDP